MQFFWINIYNWLYSVFFDLIKNPTEKTLVFTPNPEILVRASRDAQFLDILKQATHNTPDANGLYVGSMMQEGMSFIRACFIAFFHKKQVQEKYGELIKWSDLTRDIFAYAEYTNKHILIIDNYRITHPRNQFEIEKMRIQWDFMDLLKEKFPKLSITLLFDGEKTPEAIAELIQQNTISYVFSCIGMKTQETRLLEVFEFLPQDQEVVGLGVGASIDFLLGLQKRAPLIFQKLGLEWFYRLILEPRKRWKRIYTAIMEFPRLIKKSLPK